MCKWVKSRFIQLPGIQRVVAPVPGEQARQCIRPYRVHHFLNYGLVVRFRLLPTPPLGDAVSFSYGQPVFCPMGTSTPLLVRTLRRTSIRVPRVFRSVSHSDASVQRTEHRRDAYHSIEKQGTHAMIRWWNANERRAPHVSRRGKPESTRSPAGSPRGSVLEA